MGKANWRILVLVSIEISFWGNSRLIEHSQTHFYMDCCFSSRSDNDDDDDDDDEDSDAAEWNYLLNSQTHLCDLIY